MKSWFSNLYLFCREMSFLMLDVGEGFHAIPYEINSKIYMYNGMPRLRLAQTHFSPYR